MAGGLTIWIPLSPFFKFPSLLLTLFLTALCLFEIFFSSQWQETPFVLFFFYLVVSVIVVFVFFFFVGEMSSKAPKPREKAKGNPNPKRGAIGKKIKEDMEDIPKTLARIISNTFGNATGEERGRDGSGGSTSNFQPPRPPSSNPDAWSWVSDGSNASLEIVLLADLGVVLV